MKPAYLLCTAFLFVLTIRDHVASINEATALNQAFPKGKGWLSDLCALIKVNGTYFMNFECQPNLNSNKNLSWCLATSKNLAGPFTYEGEVILYDDKNKREAFDGSAVYENGLLKVVLTRNSDTNSIEGQYITYSTDGKHYTNESRLDTLRPSDASQSKSYRDPQVFRYGGHFVAIVALSNDGVIDVYVSADVKNWTLVQAFKPQNLPKAQLECPLLVELGIGGTNKTHWALIISTNPGGIAGGSGMWWCPVDFNGTHISGPCIIKPFDYGADFYAGRDWVLSSDDNRKLLAGWVNNWDYAVSNVDRYRGYIAISRELWLEEKNNSMDLFQWPIHELSEYETSEDCHSTLSFRAGVMIRLTPTQAYKMSINATLLGSTISFTIRYEHDFRVRIYYDRSNKTVCIEKPNPDPTKNGTMAIHCAPYKVVTRLGLTIYLDANTIMMFMDRGSKAMTELVFPKSLPKKIILDTLFVANVRLCTSIVNTSKGLGTSQSGL